MALVDKYGTDAVAIRHGAGGGRWAARREKRYGAGGAVRGMCGRRWRLQCCNPSTATHLQPAYIGLVGVHLHGVVAHERMIVQRRRTEFTALAASAAGGPLRTGAAEATAAVTSSPTSRTPVAPYSLPYFSHVGSECKNEWSGLIRCASV